MYSNELSLELKGLSDHISIDDYPLLLDIDDLTELTNGLDYLATDEIQENVKYD